jgi:hypothetical protein
MRGRSGRGWGGGGNAWEWAWVSETAGGHLERRVNSLVEVPEAEVEVNTPYFPCWVKIYAWMIFDLI